MDDPKTLARVLKNPSDPFGPESTVTPYDPKNPAHKKMIGKIMWDKLFPSISTEPIKKVGME